MQLASDVFFSSSIDAQEDQDRLTRLLNKRNNQLSQSAQKTNNFMWPGLAIYPRSPDMIQPRTIASTATKLFGTIAL